ncbi:hypothetical protein [Anaerotignum propionicum]|jgi:hypothetical protein|uniref:hypothetical protein n=1 Tax=Anaerotignum propionicum TaxID=28446 RepID=UPI000E81F6F6|nr:hypothetical protein [Anaerotignum propionicum]HBF64909.1 hypothetical protein [Clostridium sp.]
MLQKEELLRYLEGKTDEEKRIFLEEEFNLGWRISQGSCKLWFAKVFTYCHPNELEEQLNFFLFLVNVFGYLWNICFEQEDTIFLGCVCPCGVKQTVLYYSITFED